MKVHILTVVVIDFDDLGAEEVHQVLRHTKYPNHCISPDVVESETADIGEWSDDHPLNRVGVDTLAWLKKNAEAK